MKRVDGARGHSVGEDVALDAPQSVANGIRQSTDLDTLIVKKVDFVAFTVEVRNLHTHRLDSLKLVFQPLHKFLVNKL